LFAIITLINLLRWPSIFYKIIIIYSLARYISLIYIFNYLRVRLVYLLLTLLFTPIISAIILLMPLGRFISMPSYNLSFLSLYLLIFFAFLFRTSGISLDLLSLNIIGGVLLYLSGFIVFNWAKGRLRLYFALSLVFKGIVLVSRFF
jgi:hypothetical protein